VKWPSRKKSPPRLAPADPLLSLAELALALQLKHLCRPTAASAAAGPPRTDSLSAPRNMSSGCETRTHCENRLTGQRRPLLKPLLAFRPFWIRLRRLALLWLACRACRWLLWEQRRRSCRSPRT